MNCCRVRGRKVTQTDLCFERTTLAALLKTDGKAVRVEAERLAARV